jgi:hypothetical protein
MKIEGIEVRETISDIVLNKVSKLITLYHHNQIREKAHKKKSGIPFENNFGLEELVFSCYLMGVSEAMEIMKKDEKV